MAARCAEAPARAAMIGEGRENKTIKKGVPGLRWQDVMLEDLDPIEVISGPGATLRGAKPVPKR